MSWISRFKDFYSPLMAGSIDGTDAIPHDHAIYRALDAKYKPNPVSISGDAKRTLFIGRLSHSTTNQNLRDTFAKFGKIVTCRVIRDIVTGFSKGYGFVEFERDRDVDYAWNEGNGITIDGYRIFVDYECARVLKGWVPRRFGGGLGGKKESGQLRFGGRDRPFRQPIFLQNNSNQRDDSRRQDLVRRETGSSFSRLQSDNRRDRNVSRDREDKRYDRRRHRRSQDRHRKRESRTCDRSRSHESRTRERSRSHESRTHGRSRSHERTREPSRSHKSRTRERSRSRDKSRSTSRHK